MKTLILGGVRSGKSRLAEALAHASGLPVTVIATATAGDTEMAARIAAHRTRRPRAWNIVEEPLALAASLKFKPNGRHCFIVECLTLWLTNLLLAADATRLERERDAVLALLPKTCDDILLVSNETNLGVVPPGPLSRRFCDEAGQLHQALAQRCERVILTVAGIPTVLKGSPL